MPNIKSAAKRMRQNARRRAQNRDQRAELRTGIKKLVRLVGENEVQTATEQLPLTLSLIGKSAQKGLIHKNKAARQASRLTRKINALKTSA